MVLDTKVIWVKTDAASNLDIDEAEMIDSHVRKMQAEGWKHKMTICRFDEIGNSAVHISLFTRYI